MATTSPAIRMARADRLRRALKHLGCEKVEDILELLGCTRGQLDPWLNGRGTVPLYIAQKLRARGITSDYIYFNDTKGLAPETRAALRAMATQNVRPFRPGRPKSSPTQGDAA